jgi:tRNA (adenine57-N1/adenine58-N1)-methyltransferase catalytic subunit
LDASTIVFLLGLKPGHVVCESGTGSGAMSTTILRTIAPTGHLHTFEFNKVRADTAVEEFKQNGLGNMVTVRHRDGEGGWGYPLLTHVNTSGF